MRRHLHILRLFWSTSIAAEMEYRLNFALTFITSLGQLAGSVFAVWIFFRKLNTLGNYTFDEALVILGFFILLDGVANTFLRQNLSRIVMLVREGTLDFVLLKPIDSQFWLTFRNCSPWGVPNILAGLGLILYGGSRLGFTLHAYALGIVPLLLGLVMLYSLWFMLGTLCIWFIKIPNITHVLYQLLEAGRFPITAYPTSPMIYRLIFTFVVPVAFLTTFPADMMIGRNEFEQVIGAQRWVLLAIAFVMATGLLLFSRLFWRFALRFYTSASS